MLCTVYVLYTTFLKTKHGTSKMEMLRFLKQENGIELTSQQTETLEDLIKDYRTDDDRVDFRFVTMSFLVTVFVTIIYF